MKRCTQCNKELTGLQKLYCSIKCKNKVHQGANQRKRGLKRKLELISLFGSKCTRCGYDKNLAALVFHHKSGKDFNMGLRKLSNCKWSKLLEEVKKCDLLCHTCHMEVHYPHLNLPLNMKKLTETYGEYSISIWKPENTQR